MASHSSQVSHFSQVTTTASEYEDNLINTYITIPPDGGWGWVIVLVSFFSNAIIDGTMFTFGMYLKEAAISLETQETTIAVANSIMSGFYYGFGAVACALVNHYGFRLIAFIGAVLALLSFVVASQTNSLSVFVLSLGIFGGTGCGMAYVPSIVAVGFYFERWRSIATSIAVTGSAVGTIVLPILNKNLEAYSWRTKFLIIAGEIFLLALITFAYRPLKPVRVLKDGNDIIQLIEETDSIGSFDENPKPSKNCFKSIFGVSHNKNYPTAMDLAETETVTYNVGRTNSQTTEGSSVLYTESMMKTDRMDDAKSQLSTVYEQSENYPKQKSCCRWCPRWCLKMCQHVTKHKNRPMYRDDILYGGSLSVLPQYSRSMAATSYISRVSHVTNKNVPVLLEYHMSVSRAATQRDLENQGHTCCPESVVRILATMLDFRLLKSLAFVLLTLSGFFTCLGLYVPYIYLAPRAEEFNISERDANSMLSVLGIANGIGRILCGMFSSIPRLNATMVTYISLLICGLITCLSCIISGRVGSYICSGIFGMTIACFGALRSPMIVDLMGIENLTNAFGIILLFEGMGAATGVIMAGQFKELTGTFNACFYFAGINIIISAVLLMPIKCLSQKEAARKNMNI